MRSAPYARRARSEEAVLKVLGIALGFLAREPHEGAKP